MAFTRKMLKALGIEDEKIEQIIDAHTEVVEALKEQAEQYKADAEKYAETKKELEKLKEADGNAKNLYEKEHKAFEEYKSSVEAEKALNSKKSAFKAILEKTGIDSSVFDDIIGIQDFSAIELDESGAVKDADTLTNALKGKYSSFIVQKGVQGAKEPTPPSNTGKATLTREEIRAIKDPVERRKAIAENIEIYNQ